MTYERRPSEYPPTIRKLFGRPALVEGEDRALYDELLSLIVAEVEPSLLAEWLLVKDVADAEPGRSAKSRAPDRIVSSRAKTKPSW
jgi:hypothetical protein